MFVFICGFIACKKSNDEKADFVKLHNLSGIWYHSVDESLVIIDQNGNLSAKDHKSNNNWLKLEPIISNDVPLTQANKQNKGWFVEDGVLYNLQPIKYKNLWELKAYHKYKLPFFLPNPYLGANEDSLATAKFDYFFKSNWRIYDATKDKYLCFFWEKTDEETLPHKENILSVHQQVNKNKDSTLIKLSYKTGMRYHHELGGTPNRVLYVITNLQNYTLISMGQFKDNYPQKHYLLTSYNSTTTKGFELLPTGEYLPVVFDAYTDTLFLYDRKLTERIDYLSKNLLKNERQNTESDSFYAEFDSLHAVHRQHIDQLLNNRYVYIMDYPFPSSD